MAKLKADPIGESDLVEFLDSCSDFSFEIQVLIALTGMGFACEHGGTYDDPATHKPREFDIRATRQFGKRFVRLAVECKNVRPNNPVIISCLPRRREESFHEISISVNPEKCPLEKPTRQYSLAMLPRSKNVRVTSEHSIYKEGEPVGKSCDQVGRNLNGDIAANDSGLYEKWAQALSSAHDLTYLASTEGDEQTGDFALSMVLPLLVVPNGNLWVTAYDVLGNRIVDPQRSERCSYFVNRSYSHRSAFGADELTISHLEFVTVSGLLKFVDEVCGKEDRLEKVFAMDSLRQCFSV